MVPTVPITFPSQEKLKWQTMTRGFNGALGSKEWEFSPWFSTWKPITPYIIEFQIYNTHFESIQSMLFNTLVLIGITSSTNSTISRIVVHLMPCFFG